MADNRGASPGGESNDANHNIDYRKEKEELEHEVSILSKQMIEAMNNSADLGKQVNALRKDLDLCREERTKLLAQLENNALEMERERALRQDAESEASKTRSETVELTEKLFDEANTMVSQARRETAEVQKKNSALIAQMTERDVIIDTLQKQLTELKNVLQKLGDKKDSAALVRPKLAKQLSVNRLYSNISMDSPQGSLQSSSLATVSTIDTVAPLTQRTVEQLNEDLLYPSIRPMVRSDLASFQEFKQILYSSQHTYSDPAVSTLAGSSEHYTTTTTTTTTTSTTVTPAASTLTSPTILASSVFEKPSSSPSSTAETSTSRFHFFSTSLKDYKFFKKALTDDIEPTLRLEQAPGFSWLARRTVMSAIMEGTVVIEPIASVNERAQNGSGAALDTRPVATLSPCAFCGESRNDLLLHARMHNLRVSGKESSKDNNDSSSNGTVNSSGHSGHVGIRAAAASLLTSSSNHSSIVGGNSAATSTTTSTTSTTSSLSSTGSNHVSSTNTTHTDDSGSGLSTSTSVPVSTGYPMCHYCLTRVRAVCDFISFIRSVRDGFWKVEDAQQEIRAWRECIRLRERMFYARVGARFAAYDDESAYRYDNNGEGDEKDEQNEQPKEEPNEESKDLDLNLSNNGKIHDNDNSPADSLPIETITISDDEKHDEQQPPAREPARESPPAVRVKREENEPTESESEDEFLDTYVDHDGDVVEDVEIVEVHRATHRSVNETK